MKSYIYLPEEFKRVWKAFKEIADREGRSRSRIMRGLIAEYVRRHEPGNPQLLLTSFVEAGIRAHQPPPCVGVYKSTSDAVYCKRLGYAWIKLERCWRCWRRKQTGREVKP